MPSATAICTFETHIFSSTSMRQLTASTTVTYAIEPVAHHEIGMRHGGLQHRRRIGETGRFQHARRKLMRPLSRSRKTGFPGR